MDLGRLSAALKELGAPAYRLDQIRQGVFREGASSYEDLGVLPAPLRMQLGLKVPLMSHRLKELAVSADGTRKAALELSDGKLIETVLMRPTSRRWTTCISSQVGCAIACTFCATGLMGLSRNLTPEEITDQVLFWRQHMKRERLEGPLSNVVYMGMGEPFANYQNVAQSLTTLMDPRQFGLGARHISVSTSGLVPQIERFADEFPQVNLALSLHAPSDALRTRLVPLNKAYPLAELASAMRKYLSRSRRKVFVEYVLLKGENDSTSHAWALAEYLRGVSNPSLLHVNLILFNPTDTPHEASTEDAARKFQEVLKAKGFPSTVRKNLGRDIQGACGQLVRNPKLAKPRRQL